MQVCGGRHLSGGASPGLSGSGNTPAAKTTRKILYIRPKRAPPLTCRLTFVRLPLHPPHLSFVELLLHVILKNLMPLNLYFNATSRLTSASKPLVFDHASSALPLCLPCLKWSPACLTCRAPESRTFPALSSAGTHEPGCRLNEANFPPSRQRL